MPEPIRPIAGLTLGRENIIWVPAIATKTAPKLSEITATSAFDISRVLFLEGVDLMTQDIERVEANRRFGDDTVPEYQGTTTFRGGAVSFQYDPQSAAASVGKKAWETFGTGANGFLVQRMNIARAVDAAVGQFVNVIPARISALMPTKSGTGSASETAAAGQWFVTDLPAFNVAIVT